MQDVFGRFGSEEFALLACTNFEDAMIVAEKVHTAVGETPVDVQGAPVPVTASIGVATGKADVTSILGSAHINEADATWYTAKRGGRNRSVGFA